MDERLAGLDDREGWHVEGDAARVHYRGETDQYSIEYYAPSDCVVYWKVPPEDGGGIEIAYDRYAGFVLGEIATRAADKPLRFSHGASPPAGRSSRTCRTV